MRRNKKKTTKSVVVNVRSVVKEMTDMNVSADALSEMVELTEDMFIPILVKYSELAAKKAGKKTIQENDYLVAKDYITSAFKSYGLI